MQSPAMVESPTSDARNDALERLTGGGSGQPQSDRLSPGPSTSKANRRQTACYPQTNSSNKQSKPFSRSAAKRESVLQLGSIEHLQHYFIKSSIKAPDPMLAKKNGLGPALPHLQNPRLLPTIVADFDLPPSPAIPPQSHATPFASFERTYEVDPEALKPGVLEDLAAVVRTWHLEEGLDAELVTPTQQGAALGNSFLQPSEFNVLAALKNTTRAIRSVRNYVLALPDELPTSQVRQFRPGSLSKTPRAVKHAAKHGTGDAHVRKAALDVLTVLRDLEERARIPGTENADDSMTSSNSGGFLGEGERSLTPSSIGSDERRSSFGGAGTSGRSNSFSVPVWEDDEDEEEIDEAPKREGWDDRLVLGGGWLYRADIKIAELHKERAIIQRYLDTVDKIVFSDGSKLKSPPKTSLALTEEPEEEERFKEVQDRELPNWARRHPFGEDFDGTKRARALLAAFLPVALLPLLPIDGTRNDLLAALSSGQVLCTAYNAAVRKSKKPWGYIDADAIHDIAEETSTADKVYTFRKVENLRLFAAAVKLRYLVPLVAPGQNIPPGPEPPIIFDARVIARQETGWDDSLERVLRRWVDAVVAEKRAER